MLLIRHNRIQPPYDDYQALSIEQLDDLATNRVSPDIAALPANLPVDEGMLKAVDYFVCSQSGRTLQTCEALRRRFALSQPVERDACLNELFFVPSQLRRDVSENPLTAVRRYLYPAIAGGSPAVESAAQLKARMDELLARYADKSVLLFSHGFFMRLLQSYVAAGRDMARALHEIEKFPAVGYLEVRQI